jgi:hypothetical protein
LLSDNLHGHFTGTETVHLYGPRKLLETVLHLAIDLCLGQGDVEASLELTGLFHSCCHVISYT